MSLAMADEVQEAVSVRAWPVRVVPRGTPEDVAAWRRFVGIAEVGEEREVS